MTKQKGFTIIELIVVIAIIAILATVILFSITKYINKSKNASIQGALSGLIPTGEVWYDNNNGFGYKDFCESSAIENVNSSTIFPSATPCEQDGKPAVCCSVDQSDFSSWAACAREFSSEKFFCVDSIGHKEEITSGCDNNITTCL